MELICQYCNKKYASYQSRSNHIKKYHNTNNIQNIQSDIYSDIQNKCNKCDKILSNYYSRWRHEKNCKEIKKDNIEIKEMKDKMDKQENDIIELKNMLQKALKMHPKTLNKINNNGGMNVQIVQLGFEDLQDVLTTKQKMAILNRQAMSINDLVELINTSPEYKQYRNVCITNLCPSGLYAFATK